MNVWTRRPHWLRYTWPRAETELTLPVKGHNQLHFPRGAHLTLCKLILLVFLFCLFVLFYYLHHYLSGYYAEANRRWRPGYWTAGEGGVENEKGQGNTQETPKSAGAKISMTTVFPCKQREEWMPTAKWGYFFTNAIQIFLIMDMFALNQGDIVVNRQTPICASGAAKASVSCPKILWYAGWRSQSHIETSEPWLLLTTSRGIFGLFCQGFRTSKRKIMF